MNRQNFNQSGGFPIKTQTLDEMQKSWTLLNALGDLAGNFSIIQGCETTGANVSDGVVFINGEVLEFRGSMVGASVIIVEEVTPREFKDASTKNVLYVRYAAFGSGVVSFAWADFKRPKTTVKLSEEKAEQATVEALIARIELLEAKESNVPIGLIALWGGTFDSIPNGWEEHVPLRGRMAIGHNPDDDDFNVLGNIGGAKSKVLDVTEMPRHTHAAFGGGNFGIVADSADAGGSSSNNEVARNNQHPTTAATGGLPDGSTQAFSLMNPYRIVHYIKYRG